MAFRIKICEFGSQILVVCGIFLFASVGNIYGAELDLFEAVNLTTTTSQYVNYGEPCSDIADCDSSAYLTCVEGSCQCALSKAMIFDDATSSCWVLPGEKCIYRATEIGLGILIADISGAEERTLRGDRLSFRCVSNSACEDGYCVCDAGHYPTANRTCERQREYDETCHSDEECRSSLHLICNRGKCGCNETNSIYDMEHGLCVGLSGASCFDFEMCSENAYCPSFGIFNQYDVACTCKAGFFESSNRTCVPKKEYDQPCVSNDECREDLSLICNTTTNKCACNTTSHLYDAAEGKCLSLVGTSCSEISSCIPNAECQHAGFLNGNVLARNMVCRCGYGYFETSKKTCEQKQEFDRDCEDDSQCRDDLKLICNKVTGTCACNDTSHTYDRSRRRCIGLAGTYCERNEQCVINSMCRSPGYLYPRLSPKAECICKDGFHKTNDGFCLGKYGTRCESWTSSCNENLVCRNGECSCKLGNHQQYYDYTLDKCMTYVGAPCDGMNDTSCISNAYCGPNPGRTGYSCMCGKGFVPMNGGKKCAALVGEKCSEGDYHGVFIPCVPHARCHAGFCECALDYYTSENKTCERKQRYGEYCTGPENCEDSYCDPTGKFCSCNKATSMFDPTRKTCMRLAGAKCFDLRDCVPNALCRSPGRLNPVDSEATCICKEGYFISSNHTCEWKRGYGESCSDNAECQDAGDLVCSVHGRCECNSTISIYDEKRRVCVRLAGAPCSSHQQCIAHAKCQNPLYWIHYDTYSPGATCQCDTELGYTNSSDGRCMIDYYGGKCDIASGLYCSSKFICEEGKCLCPYEEHQKYDFNLKTCLSLVKGPCENATNSCVKNAHCTKTEEGLSECRCKKGFIAVDRGCELTFGQPCSSNYSRVGNQRIHISRGSGDYGVRRRSEIGEGLDDEPRCDRLAPLKCVHGTCQCGGFQFYDYELQKCRGLLGSRCDPDDKQFCTEGAFCEPFRSAAGSVGGNGGTTKTKRRYGRCKCMTGYSGDGNRTCTRDGLGDVNNAREK